MKRYPEDFHMPDGDGKAALTVFRSGGNDGFTVQLDGFGFESHRYLEKDDLRELRDWINRELGEGS